MAGKHYLPSKVGNYFKRLELEYSRSSDIQLLELITSSRVLVIEETSYDSWNGGTSTHDIKLFLPPQVIGKISFGEQRQICDQLLDDMNKCANAVDNESFRRVDLELADDTDPEFQRARALSQQPVSNPDGLSIWAPNCLRLFISHRDTHKKAARRLADALLSFGVSAFVAHDTIEPMTTWQREIEKGLETMEVMLAFVTNDFHDSSWTNQEVGYALGKGIPIISVKFQQKSPFGFIGSKQALPADLDDPKDSAIAIYRLLVEKLGQRGRLQKTLISSFCSAPDFNEARDRFDRMDTIISSLSDEEIEQIQEAYAANDQLHNAIYLNNNYDRLKDFLKKCTGEEFVIKNNKLSRKRAKRVPTDMDDEIPF